MVFAPCPFLTVAFNYSRLLSFLWLGHEPFLEFWISASLGILGAGLCLGSWRDLSPFRFGLRL